MEHKKDLLPLLEYINPSALDYQDWINVGMALKEEGYTATDWDSWSQSDSSRYIPGECFRKWTTFNGSMSKVTGGTIYHLACEHGYQPSTSSKELDWDSVISYDSSSDYKFIDNSWVQGIEIREPKHWNPTNEVIKYLETLFTPNEYVGYQMEFYEFEDKEKNPIYKPKNGGQFKRTAGELIDELTKYSLKGEGQNIGFALGDYNPEAGAYIRFNPLDGEGVSDSNITDYRYALVESDGISVEMQNAIMRELELPIACLVHSGGKSVHAIVKINASSYTEYKKRVDYLYSICDKNGLKVDKQNKNPSRFSRLPGVVRKGKKQFIIDTNIGKNNFEEWQEYIEELNDDLPDFESLSDYVDNIPELAPELIKGVLRQGHKMLMAGASKAGKSFALMELCIAIAEGVKWFGFDCKKGKVLYVNLELDSRSCINRFNEIYNAMGLTKNNWNNIQMWHLRGKTVPMDKLAPKLIRRAVKERFTAIVIDPIYKVLTGDENSADQMAHFTNQFDKLATELGSSVIYCHHHSKGSQGNKKSMDRASGSGVFARDPDALIDLVELELNNKIVLENIKEETLKFYWKTIKDFNNTYYQELISSDNTYSIQDLREHISKVVPKDDIYLLDDKIRAIKTKIYNRTAWRVESTLREFPKFKPVNIWFDYPLHRIDTTGVLEDIDLADDKPQWQKALESRRSKEDNKQQRRDKLESAYNATKVGNVVVTTEDIRKYLGVKSCKTIENYINEHPDFDHKNGVVVRK